MGISVYTSEVVVPVFELSEGLSKISSVLRVLPNITPRYFPCLGSKRFAHSVFLMKVV